MVSADGAEGRDNRRELRAAGLPSGGGYGNARGLVAFYQMLLNRGTLNGKRIVSPRLIAYVAKNQTGEMPDAAMAGIPMHRGARRTCSRRERPHSRPRHDRRAERIRPWRRGLVLFLGRPDQRRVVQLSDQPLRQRAIPFAAARPGGPTSFTPRSIDLHAVSPARAIFSRRVGLHPRCRAYGLRFRALCLRPE